MKPGDLVRYMSRLLLVLEVGDVWVRAIECGETEVARYKRTALREMR